MADAQPQMATLNPALSRRLLAVREADAEPVRLALRPELAHVALRAPTATIAPRQPAPAPPPAPAPAPEPGPPPAPPEAPASDPFAELPYPSPGDRIRAEDFRSLSQGLRIIADAYALAGAMFGQPFAVAAAALAAQGYEVARVLSVGGTELGGPGDPALDDRRVVHVAPAALGGTQVHVVVTEAVGRGERRMPSLLGLTYRQAQARLQAEIGDLVAGAGPMTVPQLVGRTFGEAQRGVA